MFHGISRGFDLVEGRTWHVDMITVSVRSWRGNKYIIGGRDECTGYMFAIYIERRSDAVNALIEFIKTMRRDPELRNPEIFGRIWLDPAGEWHKRHSHSGLSAAEDEYMALCHVGRQVVWLRHLLTDCLLYTSPSPRDRG